MPDGYSQFTLKTKAIISKKHHGAVIIPQSQVVFASFSAHHSIAHQKVAATHGTFPKSSVVFSSRRVPHAPPKSL
jgi:hypothetical protein